MKTWMLFLGPTLAFLAGASLYGSSQLTADAAWTLGVAILCAIWWVFEPIPIPATSMIPLAVMPLVGVLSPTEVAQSYGDQLILLMMGGFILSTAVERSGAHQRLALNMVKLMGGTGGKRLVLGFMFASAMLSMWITNTAVVLMLLPIVSAVNQQTDNSQLKCALLLGIAYAANIGGVGTPIGTPPNLVFIQKYQEATSIEIGFLTWMSWTIPIVAVMTVLSAIWLTRKIKDERPLELPKVGEWTSPEVRTLVVFAVTAALWITRSQPLGGWSGLVGLPTATDASVALLAVVAMFIVPGGDGRKLLDWPTAAKIPWGVLILFGGGITLAKAFQTSQLSEVISQVLSSLGQLPMFFMIAAVCLGVTFLTEVTSNTATATLLMVVLPSTAKAAGIDDLRLLMVPATISASFAFMLPVATPPNAVVFGGSKELTIKMMASEGLALNLIGAAVASVGCFWLFG